MFYLITNSFNVNRPSVIAKAALWCSVLLCMVSANGTFAQETICAEVKIEIAQELTIERQAFEAKLKIENTLSDKSLTHINVVVEFTDGDGQPVLATSDSSNTAADFFIRVNSLDGINGVEGNGVLGASQTAEATWLIIPAPGASDDIPSGKLVFVGARFEYKLDGIDGEIVVAPDSIYVRPMPLLGLDYFLPRDVFADDPLTQEVEAVEPFTLGVRIQNNGSGTGNSIKIDSAQPKIVENDQGLTVDFKLLDSFVQDQEVSNSLLLDFGDIPSGESKMGRWIMTTSLSGRFTEFDAEFSHADELGGELTSLLEDVTTHFLMRDVIVDAPGRDNVKDFLAFDVYDDLLRVPDEIKVFESNSTTTPVTNLSSAVQFNATALANGGYSFKVNPHTGFMVAEMVDPFAGSKEVARALRSDGKEMNLNNVWLSKRYDKTSKETTHYMNVFDFNTTGDYTLFLETPVLDPRPPIWQQVPYRTTVEGQNLGFVVQASDPDGTVPALSALNLPAGASFTDTGNGYASFQWTPAIGQAGDYTIPLFATDGALTENIDMFVVVNAAGDSDGDGLPDQWEIDQFGSLDRDGTEDLDEDGVSDLDEFEDGTDPNTQDAPLPPVIITPVFDGIADSRQPTLMIENSQYDGPHTVVYVFEVFSDAAYGPDDLVSAYYSQEQGEGGETSWLVGTQLAEDTEYFWRVRASNSFTHSAWVDGRFIVNSQNVAPSAPTINSPNSGAQVNAGSIALVVGNGVDSDGEALEYEFFVYEDIAGSTLLERSGLINEQEMGNTQWQPTYGFVDGLTYYWRANVTDGVAAPVNSAISSFSLAIVNLAPNTPTISSPSVGERIASETPTLVIVDAVDDRGANNVSYLFEVDSSDQFDSAAKLVSGWLSDGGTEPTFSWLVPQAMKEDSTFFWRVKARDVDGLESAWVVGSFRVNTVNSAPDMPIVKNPGDGSQVITLQPKLEVHPVVDVDSDTVQYTFELASDATFATVLQSATVAVAELMLQPLDDDHIYYWRAKAIDAVGAESAWSNMGEFFVNENNFDNPPTFTWLLPEGSTTVTEGEVVTLRWQDEDLDSSATIVLSYADNALGSNRASINREINEDDDLSADTYEWSTAGLAPGDYYLFAIISDNNNSEAVAAEDVFKITVEERPFVAAQIIEPFAGAVLPNYRVTFKWNDVGADEYKIRLGTALGLEDLSGTSYAADITEVVVSTPQDGSEFYVKLFSRKDGLVKYSLSGPYTSYKDESVAAEVLSPAANSIMTEGKRATFTWNDVGADNYNIYIARDIEFTDKLEQKYLSGNITSYQSTRLPIDGSKFYVRILSHKTGVSKYSQPVEYQSYLDTSVASELLSPLPGTVMTEGKRATFTWNDVGADNYNIYIARDIEFTDKLEQKYLSGNITSYQSTRLPIDGSKFYVRILSHKTGVSKYSQVVEYQSYTDTSVASQLLLPSSGEVFNSKEAFFTWSDVGADNYSLSIGSEPGKNDIVHRFMVGDTFEYQAKNLPLDGRKIYVTLRSHFTHIAIKETPVEPFTAHTDVSVASQLLSPITGTTFTSKRAIFKWSDVGADIYRLSIGSAPGAGDILNYKHMPDGVFEYEVSDLPVDGREIYATVHSQFIGISVKDAQFGPFTAYDE